MSAYGEYAIGLRERIVRLESALSALVDHVREAAPTGWAACGRDSDMADATKWDREAMPLLAAADAALADSKIAIKTTAPGMPGSHPDPERCACGVCPACRGEWPDGSPYVMPVRVHLIDMLCPRCGKRGGDHHERGDSAIACEEQPVDRAASSVVVPWWICRHCALVVRSERRYGNCTGQKTTAAEHEWLPAHFASLVEPVQAPPPTEVPRPLDYLAGYAVAINDALDAIGDIGGLAADSDAAHAVRALLYTTRTDVKGAEDV